LTTSSYNIYDTTDKFRFAFSRDVVIDEASFWTSVLNISDINILYNSGDGLNYSGIVSGSSGETEVPSSISYSLYNICIPSLTGYNLCEELVITDGSPFCAITDLEICSLGCIDKVGYWESLNMSPASMDYEGRCDLCPNPCSYLGQLSCDGSYIMKCNLLDNGCYAFTQDKFCINGCISGVCNTTGLPLGETTQESYDIWNNFFGISTDTNSNRFLIAIIGILLTGLLGVIMFAGFSYMSGTKLPFMIGLILGLSLMILTFFYFVVIGFIPLWSLILLVIILALIIAGYVRSKIIG
jgi:hypothetical protein